MATAKPIATNFHAGKRHSEFERWVCIYPAYINSKKTRQQGRRLQKDKCVENPTYAQIRDVLSVTNLPVAVENKQYSREPSREPQCRGRVRVQMRNDNGDPLNAELATRDDILLYVATRIPQLKSFHNKTSETFAAPIATGAASTSGQSGGAAAAGKKHRGKRR